MNLFLVEARRALHRRAVWVLLGVAGLGIAAIAVVAFTDSAGIDTARLRAMGERHPAVMADWWVAGTADGFLILPAVFLALGGLIGGAVVAGGEWRAGTVGTVLTWEPRRWRLHAARLGAYAACAWVLAVALQAVLLAALLPAALAHGSTSGTDSGWWLSLFGAMARIAAVAALAAVLGGALATAGRATAAALVGAGMWLAVGEPLLRAWRPGWGGHLVAENVAVVITWGELDGTVWSRAPVVALTVLAAYGLAAVALAGASFARRDIGAV